MSSYEIYLLSGSLLVLLGILSAIATMTNWASAKYAVLFLVLGAGLLYYAHISNFDGLDFSNSKGLFIGDVPDAIYKLIGKVLN